MFAYNYEIPHMTNNKKLTINTSVANGSMFAGSAVSPGSAMFQPSPIRRRNNYNSGDMGPMFSNTKQLVKIMNKDRTEEAVCTVQAKIDKGFFLSDNDWTCYRRNYFQVSGAFNFVGRSLVDGQEHQIADPQSTCFIEFDRPLPIVGFRIGISANVAANDKGIDIVQHTSKRDKGPQSVPEPKKVKAGGSLTANHMQQLMSPSQTTYGGGSAHIATFDRLQFKSATANNGKRRAAQQYYVLNMDLYAEIQDYDGIKTVKIAVASSAPLVVRGRSPGHYHDGDRVGSPYQLMAANSLAEGGFLSPQSSMPLGNSMHSMFPTPMDNRMMMPMTSAYQHANNNNGANGMIFSPTANFKPTISHDVLAGLSSATLASARSERSPVDSYIPSATFSDRSPLYQEVTYNNHGEHNLQANLPVTNHHQESYLPDNIGGDLFSAYEL